MAEMLKRIEEQTEGQKQAEVLELNLDSCEASQITGLSDAFVNLETLTITNNNLTSLKGLPNLPNLKKLDLSDNQLADGLELLLSCPELVQLNLNGNLFKDLSSLEPLKKLQSLQHLELDSCPITEKDDYRTQILEMLPELEVLDGIDRSGNPVPTDDYDDDEGEEGGSDEEDDVGSDECGDGDDDVDDEDDGSDDEDNADRGTKRKHDDDEEDDA